MRLKRLRIEIVTVGDGYRIAAVIGRWGVDWISIVPLFDCLLVCLFGLCRSMARSPNLSLITEPVHAMAVL